LCDFMIYNTCILFFDLSFFGLGPEVESDQAAQPLALLCPSNLARKDKEWTHVGSKWKCKVGNCTIAYCVKWLLTKHLKEVHGLVAEKSKPGRPSTTTGGPRHHDHAKMNVRILGNAMVVQRRNDQKVASRACAKAQREWENLVAVAKQCPPFPKPGLVKLASKQLVVRIHIAYQHTLLPCQFTAMLESMYRETLTPKDSNNQCYQSSQPNLQLQGRHKGLGEPHTLSTHKRLW
jgi:hypothetical protein